MFEELERINKRPEPFESYTASDLWTDEHTSAQMLSFHLNETIDVSSRNAEFINRSVEWIASRFNVGMNTAIADFGCGPGLYATRLARRGAYVTGIDFSKRSIEYAKEVAVREQLNISYVNQNYLEFETGDRFDLARRKRFRWTSTQLLNRSEPERCITGCNILHPRIWRRSYGMPDFLLWSFIRTSRGQRMIGTRVNLPSSLRGRRPAQNNAMHADENSAAFHSRR